MQMHDMNDGGQSLQQSPQQPVQQLVQPLQQIGQQQLQQQQLMMIKSKRPVWLPRRGRPRKHFPGMPTSPHHIPTHHITKSHDTITHNGHGGHNHGHGIGLGIGHGLHGVVKTGFAETASVAGYRLRMLRKRIDRVMMSVKAVGIPTTNTVPCGVSRTGSEASDGTTSSGNAKPCKMDLGELLTSDGVDDDEVAGRRDHHMNVDDETVDTRDALQSLLSLSGGGCVDECADTDTVMTTNPTPLEIDADTTMQPVHDTTASRAKVLASKIKVLESMVHDRDNVISNMSVTMSRLRDRATQQTVEFRSRLAVQMAQMQRMNAMLRGSVINTQGGTQPTSQHMVMPYRKLSHQHITPPMHHGHRLSLPNVYRHHEINPATEMELVVLRPVLEGAEKRESQDVVLPPVSAISNVSTTPSNKSS